MLGVSKPKQARDLLALQHSVQQKAMLNITTKTRKITYPKLRTQNDLPYCGQNIDETKPHKKPDIVTGKLKKFQGSKIS